MAKKTTKTSAKATKGEAAKQATSFKPLSETTPKAAKANAKKAAKATKATTEPKTKKVSALDAAAQVLAKAKEPMNAKDMIAAMAEQKLWVSPGGKTPHATLYAAILREINVKGAEARFKKTDRGHFAAK